MSPPPPGSLLHLPKISEQQDNDSPVHGYELDQTVLHIQSPTIQTMYIQCPKAESHDDKFNALGVRHLWMHLQVRNLGREWAFEGFLNADPIYTAEYVQGDGIPEDRYRCDRFVYHYLFKLPTGTYSQVIPSIACTGAHRSQEKVHHLGSQEGWNRVARREWELNIVVDAENHIFAE